MMEPIAPRSGALRLRCFLVVTILFVLSGCGGGGSSSSTAPTPSCSGGTPATLLSTSSNQMLVYQSTCQGLVNTPVVTLKICVPNTTNCEDVPNVLVDIGSTGLRLSHTVSIAGQLPQEQLSGQGLFECYAFVSGYNYGPVVSAQITLGNESALTVPVQISNSSLSAPTSCSNNGPSAPFQPDYNGILGLLFPQYDDGIYYNGSGGSLVNGTGTLSTSQQTLEVQNPVFLLPTGYNNGVLLSGFPNVPTSTGESNVQGVLTFGVDTETNNSPSDLTSLETHSDGSIDARYNGQTLPAFFDTGSNGLFIDNATITQCTGNLAGFFCGNANQSATLAGTNSQSVTFSFFIVDAQTLFSTGNNDFSSLGGFAPGIFDAGFPAFLTGNTIGVKWGNSVNTTGAGYFLYP